MKILVSALAALLLLAGSADAVEYTGGNSRDPFGTASLTSGLDENTGGMVLGGLIWSSTNPMAVVDGQVVKVGDKIGDIQVVDISKEGVKLARGGAVYVLRQKKGQQTT